MSGNDDRYDKDPQLLALARSLVGRSIVSASLSDDGSSATLTLGLSDGRDLHVGASGSLHDEAYLVLGVEGRVREKPPVYTTGVGQTLATHAPSSCAGRPCVVHNPSDHPMSKFPTLWRSDRDIMERICPHGVGHPDPDDLSADRSHGCDGCCGGGGA